MKIVNIYGENLRIFWATWEILRKFSLKFHPLSRRYILEKPQGWGGAGRGGGGQIDLSSPSS